MYQIILSSDDFNKVNTFVTGVAYNLLPSREEARAVADILSAAPVRSTFDWQAQRELEAMRDENGNLESRLRDAMRHVPGDEVIAA